MKIAIWEQDNHLRMRPLSLGTVEIAFNNMCVCVCACVCVCNTRRTVGMCANNVIPYTGTENNHTWKIIITKEGISY